MLKPLAETKIQKGKQTQITTNHHDVWSNCVGASHSMINQFSRWHGASDETHNILFDTTLLSSQDR